MIGFFFIIFASLVLIGSLGVVLSKNSVHSVLWLIFVFTNAAGLFLLLNAEFLALTLVIVYVGAVAVLFLFVVMMLGNKFFSMNNGMIMSKKQLVVSMAFILLLAADLTIIVSASNTNLINVQGKEVVENITNTEAIGRVLYTEFLLPFQLAGIILFVAMIGSIVLTFEKDNKRKRQNKHKQLSRNKDSSIKLMQIDNSKGLEGIKYD